MKNVNKLVKILLGLSILFLSIGTLQSQTPRKLIFCYETGYQRAIAQDIDSTLTEANFVYYNSGAMTTILQSVDALYGGLPENEKPLVIFPTAQMQNAMLRAPEFPRVNMLVCFYSSSLTGMPNVYNMVTPIPPNLVLVSGGNISNDWTSGAGLAFIDSSRIQYVESDFTPRYDYKITKIINNNDGTAKIYSSIMPSHTRAGWLVWVKTTSNEGISRTSKSSRLKILSVNQDSGYILVDRAKKLITQVSSNGFLTSHWLSGAVTAAGVKIFLIMSGRNCSFQDAVICARMTASNNGIWRSSDGYGHINVSAAILYNLFDNSPRIFSSTNKKSSDITTYNYPNPFNPSTSIHFSLPDKVFVSIKVYDVNGREVRMLINEIKEAGDYKVNFDGYMLPSGIYYYTIESSVVSVTRKMMLIK